MQVLSADDRPDASKRKRGTKRPRSESVETDNTELPDAGWHWFTSLPHESSEVCEANKILLRGRVCIVKGKQAILYQDKYYVIPSSFVAQHWPLHCLAAAPEDCPFRVYGCFYIDDKNAIRVPFYELWLNEDQFLHCMNTTGHIAREIVVNKLIRASMASCLGSDTFLELLKSETSWRPIVQWMQTLENNIAQNNNVINADLSCVPIGNTGWVYNKSRDLLANISQDLHRHTALHYRGGVLGGSTHDVINATARLLVRKDFSLDAKHFSLDALHLPDSDTYFPTRATLIVVPYDLPYQWEQLVTLSPQLKMVKLLTFQDLEKLTQQTVQEADVILTTYQLLKSKKYHDATEHFVRNLLVDFETPSYLMVQPAVIRAATRSARIIADDNTSADSKDANGYTGYLPLQSYHWARVIYDNVEQLFVSARGRRQVRSIAKLAAGVTWGFTRELEIGPDGLFQHYCNSFHVEPCVWTFPLCQELMETCFRQIVGPNVDNDVKQHYHWVKLSAMEQRLFDYYNQPGQLSSSDQIQLCSYYHLHHSILNTETIRLEPLSYIVKTLQDTKTRKLEGLTQTLLHHQTRLQSVKGKLDHPELTVEVKEILQRKQERVQGHIDVVEKSIQDLNKTLAYFESTARELGNQNEYSKCPVCFDHEADTLTKCGHTFCRACLLQQLDQVAQKCPMCNCALQHQDAFQIKNMAHDRYGTKMNTLLQSLEQWKAEKQQIIVCSQFLPLLRILKSILDECKIPCSFLTGNTISRQSSLAKFNEKRNQVMLIPLESLSVGIEAPCDQLVFLNALSGDLAHKTHVYKQILQTGTPKLGIHWFLTENTVESAFVPNSH